MLSKKHLVVVGDSYCSSARTNLIYNEFDSDAVGQQVNPDPKLHSWIDVAANHLNLNLYSFGYAGRSWYYSRQALFRYIADNPGWVDQIECMVFCHTDAYRYNTGNGGVHNSLYLSDSYRDHQQQLLANALRNWTVELMDPPFQGWAQEQWFYEIAREFKHINQIHFNNYHHTVEKSINILPGVVFTTPLVYLSLGETSGTDEEIVKKYMTHDSRVNHFNAHNNIALGNLVSSTVQTYQPGHYTIDSSKFDIVNPNATKWPNPGFGTC